MQPMSASICTSSRIQLADRAVPNFMATEAVDSPGCSMMYLVMSTKLYLKYPGELFIFFHQYVLELPVYKMDIM